MGEEQARYSGVERRRVKALQQEHDSLGKSQAYASEIERYGDDILTGLSTQE